MVDNSIALQYQPMNIDVAGDLAKAYALKQQQLGLAFQQGRLGAIQGLSNEMSGSTPVAQQTPLGQAAAGMTTPTVPNTTPDDPHITQAYGGPQPMGQYSPSPTTPLAAAGAAQGGAPAPAQHPVPGLFASSVGQPSSAALQRLAMYDPAAANAFVGVGKTVADTNTLNQALRTNIMFQNVSRATDPTTWKEAVDMGVGLGIITPQQAQQYGQYSPLLRAQLLQTLGGADNYFKMQGVYADKGMVQNPDGSVTPMPGFAEQQANIEGQKTAATYPYKVGEALASNAGRPIAVGGDQSPTTGFQIMNPAQQALITNPTGTGGPKMAVLTQGNNIPTQGAPPPSSGGTGTTADLNNPGGIKNPQGGFRNYATMGEGINAVAQNLTAYGQNGINTVAGIVSTWAPPGDQNNTPAYIADVAKQVGVDPNAPLNMQDPRVLAKLTGAIVNHEVGTIGSAPQQTAQAGTSVIPPQPLAPPAPGQTAAQAGQTPQPAQNPAVTSAIAGIPVTPGGFPPASFPQGSLAAPPGVLDPYTPGLVRDANGNLTNRMSGPSAALAQGKVTEYNGKDKDNYQAAQMLQGNLDLAQHAADELNKSNWTTTGSGSQSRNDLLKSFNGMLTAAGLDPVAPDSVANFESLMKTSTRMGFDLSRTLGSREAQQIVTQAIGAVPSVGNTPQGFNVITQALRQGAQRQVDFYNFETDYARDNKGVLAGADTAFNQKFPPALYAKRAIALGSVPVTPMAHAGEKAPMTAFEYLKAHPDTATQFDKTFGPGLAEYILSQ